MTTLDTIIAYAKRRGFVYPTSEIYGGLANSYDYGPYGVELLRNIRDLWWKFFIHERDDMVGIDSQIVQHPTTWVASGHVGSFTDPLVEDMVTHKRYRADHVIEIWLKKQEEKNSKISKELQETVVENMKIEDMARFIRENNIASPEGHPLTEPKPFNLLFETQLGTVSGDKSVVYLRGETAQGIFANFKQITDTTRMRLPFGVGQIGKSFRNEITQGQFVFRTFEFEQAEIEYFFDPEQEDWKELMDRWKNDMFGFVTHTLGVTEANLRWRRHTDKERSHYSCDTYDLDYHFPFGWKELWGIAYRTDYDLKAHMQHAGASLAYKDPKTGKVFVPHVIEPAVGVNRLFLMALTDALHEEDLGEGKKRTVLTLAPALAPVKAAVFPLQKDPKLRDMAHRVFDGLAKKYRLELDDAGNIGKMYRRQDEIGTPYCNTVDFQSLDDQTVTVRDRDTMKQERLAVDDLEAFLDDHIQ